MDTNNKDSVEVIKLRHPVQLNGTTHNELRLDYEELSSDEQFAIERAYRVIYKDQQPEPVAMTDPRFLVMLAAAAAKLNPEELKLKGSDVRKVVNSALVFCGGRAE